MPKYDQNAEAKSGRISKAWDSQASGETLAGMTKAEFDAKVAATKDKRAERVALLAQLRANSEEILAADQVTRDTIQAVVGAVRGAPAHGSDSALLAAMGYDVVECEQPGDAVRTPHCWRRWVT